MENILGLDLGTNSIGWALRNPLLQDNQIEKFGVITFNKGVGKDKTGEFSYAAERTKKRSTRRLYQARKYRLWATLEVLINEGYCPLTIENLDRWRKYSKEEARKNENGGRVYPVDDKLFDAWIKLDFDGDGKPDYISPYQLRKELAETVLNFTNQESKYKLGRALYHIAQRRGFKSSRKGADDVKEKEGKDDEELELQYSEKKKNKVIQEHFEKHPEAKTIGGLFAILETNGQRIRESIAQFAIRENFKEEIKHIFHYQNISFSSNLYSKLVESGKNKNDGSIFYKRPLRSQKGLVGKCTLEPSKYRVPVSHPSFEKFRAWSFINNIKYKTVGDKGASWMSIQLPLKQDIYQKLFFRKKAYFPFQEIADFIKKSGKNWELNYKLKTTVTGCPVSARLREIFGEDFENVRIPKAPSPKAQKEYYDLEDIWHVLFSYEDQEYITSFAEEKLLLKDKHILEFVKAWNATPVGYAMLSLNAINKINVFLEQGLIYTEAVLLANLPEVIGKETFLANKEMFVRNIGNVILENRHQKTILTIVNSLIARHKNLPDQERFGYKNNEYKLDETDIQDIYELIIEQIGQNTWNEKSEEDKKKLFDAVKESYQAYFKSTGFELKFINGEKHFIVKTGGYTFYKTETGFFRLPKLIDSLADFLIGNFNVNEKQLSKIYHPSEIEIYPKAKEDKKDGIVKLGSPKTGSFKNPMAMRALHELRKLINYLIETRQIDSDTKVVVEVARDLNDANKRWAIETWQRRREEENQEFATAIEQLLNEKANLKADPNNQEDREKMRLWYELNENDQEELPPVTEDKKEIKGLNWQSTKRDSYKEILAKKEKIDKYRLWLEQDCRCMYTGKMIKLTDLFGDNVIDFEHTIPRSISFDNSMANLTVCFANYNRGVKKNNIPFNLPNYDKEWNGYQAILPRLEKWQEKVERIKQQIEYWKTKSKKASTKEFKDKAIKERHLWQMELEYWKNKVDRFTISEITAGFKNSQKVDTQLISKYAFHYLKSYFERVDVQKGSITSDFRKIYGLQVSDEKKDRSKHSHHAKDAAVLTLIPVASKRDDILKDYYEHKENHIPYESKSAFKGFRREFVWNIDDSILINNIAKNQTLTPAKRVIRKRGKVQLIEGTNDPKIATGDCIRGQLHGETFFGAIRLGQKDENGRLLKDEEGNFIQSEETKYVVRVPLTFKKGDSDGGSFKKLEDLEKVMVDKPLFAQIKMQVEEDYNGSFKDALEQGVYMYDKKGNKVNKIRRVRIEKDVSNPLKIKKQTYLSSKEYKQFYYATNGENVAYGLYKSKNSDKKEYEIVSLFDASKINKTGSSDKFELEKEITIKKEVYQLLTILVSEQKVIFFSNGIEELKSLPLDKLSEKMYKIDGFEKDGRIRFKHHLSATTDQELKQLETKYGKGIYQGFSSLNAEFPWPKLKLSLSNLKMAIEDHDFKMKMDGSIYWLK